MSLIKVNKRAGSFNWLNPDTKQVLYEFYGVNESGKPENFFLDKHMDYDISDFESPLELAEFLLSQIREYYFMYSDKESLENMIEYMKSVEIKQIELRRTAKLESLILKKDRLENKLKHIKDEIERLRVG